MSPQARTVSDAALLRAVEESMFAVHRAADSFERLAIPGVDGWIGPLSHNMANRVGMASLTAENADSTIAAVIDAFASMGKGFQWLVGPHSTPADLSQRLLAAGLIKVVDMGGLVRRNLAISGRVASDVNIRKASIDDQQLVIDTMARGFGIQDEIEQLYVRARFQSSQRSRFPVYLAFVDGIEEPVGAAAMDFVPGLPVVRLGGAATLPDHRGKGVYSSLIERRLADARKAGAVATVIQSAAVTSQPICEKLGFEMVCEMASFAWVPEEERIALQKVAAEWTKGAE